MRTREKLQEIIERGRSWSLLMEGGLDDVIDSIEYSCMREWADTKADEHEARDALYHRIKAVRDIKVMIKSAAIAARNAEKEIDGRH